MNYTVGKSWLFSLPSGTGILYDMVRRVKHAG
jgi:hypothetical protein